MPRKNPRWRRRKDARPAEILDAALACFAENGFAATRLDDIAKRAGVTRGTLYLYFSSKEDLFKAMVSQVVVPEVTTREAVAAKSTGSIAGTVHGLMLSLVELVRNDRVSVMPKIVFSEARKFPELAKFYLNEVVRRNQKLVGSLLREGIKRGEFRDIDVDQAFFCVMSPILLTMLWRHSFGNVKGAPKLEALCKTHADLLLHGLMKPGAVS